MTSSVTAIDAALADDYAVRYRCTANADWDAPANAVVTERAPLEQIAEFIG